MSAVGFDLRSDFAFAGVTTPDDIDSSEEHRRWDLVEAHFAKVADDLGIEAVFTRDEQELQALREAFVGHYHAYQDVHDGAHGAWCNAIIETGMPL